MTWNATLAAMSLGILLAGPATAASPTEEQTSGFTESEGGVEVRGWVHGGLISLASSQSFEALSGSSSGTKFGAGGQLNFANGVFIQGGIERFRKSGTRAFLFNGELFPLGISDTVTVTPITFSGGYRFMSEARVVPYVGGGIGSYGFREVSEFAEAEDIVDDRFVGFQLLGGAEIGLWRGNWLSISTAAEVEYARVADALGEGGLSAEFLEDDLGGTTFRFKLQFGFGGKEKLPPPEIPAPAAPRRAPVPMPQEVPPPPAPVREPPVPAPALPEAGPPPLAPEEPQPPPRQPPAMQPPPVTAPAPPVPLGEELLLLGHQKLSIGDHSGAAADFHRYLQRYAGNKYTLALGLFCDAANVQRQVANAAGARELLLVPMTSRGQSCYGVYWGIFDTLRDARANLASIPMGLRAPGQTALPISRLLR